MGRHDIAASYILDFKKLLGDSGFPALMKDMLALISKVYEYPVDIEFTGNFYSRSDFRVNLLQCRPLQTRGLGRSVELPHLADAQDCIFSGRGNFMGGNVRIPLDFIIYIRPQEYLHLTEQDKYAVARHIGALNTALKGKHVMLLGPGRWGTTTPALGVPVRFAELAHMAIIGEIASKEAGFMPELSYGSHFFQDIVESGIFYVAIFDGQKDVVFNPARILDKPNVVETITPGGGQFAEVIHVIAADGIEVYSDVVTQTVLCR